MLITKRKIIIDKVRKNILQPCCKLQGGAAVSVAPTKLTELSQGGAAVSVAPTKLTEQTIGGYGILPYPRSHQTIFPQKPQNPQKPLAEISSHRWHRCSQIFLAEIFSHGWHRTRRILVHPVCAIVGGYGIPAIPTHPPRGCSGLHCTNKAATASSHRIHRIHRNLLLKYPPTDVTDTHRYFLLRYPPTDVTDAHRYFLLRYSPTDCTEHAEF